MKTVKKEQFLTKKLYRSIQVNQNTYQNFSFPFPTAIFEHHYCKKLIYCTKQWIKEVKKD